MQVAQILQTIDAMAVQKCAHEIELKLKRVSITCSSTGIIARLFDAHSHLQLLNEWHIAIYLERRNATKQRKKLGKDNPASGS